MAQLLSRPPRAAPLAGHRARPCARREQHLYAEERADIGDVRHVAAEEGASGPTTRPRGGPRGVRPCPPGRGWLSQRGLLPPRAKDAHSTCPRPGGRGNYRLPSHGGALSMASTPLLAPAPRHAWTPRGRRMPSLCAGRPLTGFSFDAVEPRSSSSSRPTAVCVGRREPARDLGPDGVGGFLKRAFPARSRPSTSPDARMSVCSRSKWSATCELAAVLERVSVRGSVC